MKLNDPRKTTKAERLHWYRGTDALRQLEFDLHDLYQRKPLVPPDWHEIATSGEARDTKTVRVTIRLDADVVKFFKALGPGYQPKINRVLRAFMHLRLGKVLNGADTSDHVLHPDRVVKDLLDDRPKEGETEEIMEEARRRRLKRKAAQQQEDDG